MVANILHNSLMTIASILACIGAINWGLSVFNFNLVEFLFGTYPFIVKLIYALVGLSGLYALWKTLVPTELVVTEKK